ncbi:glycosyltransferase family 4 protein [Salinisphaera sp. SPP-AMP-43]|uniref:glycosyltransferase family 4 protein n=1 Tax=Salinisphaera sp. SPP-AMP-43 TaxID=3121288 RepID=UPI003C6E89D3
MRIAYVVDTFPKRSETFVRDEVEWLARRGQLDRVFSVATEDQAIDEISAPVRDRLRRIPTDPPGRIEAALCKTRWAMHQPGLFWSRLNAWSMSRESFTEFVYGLRLARMLREDPPDVMHVHFASLAAQIARYASRLSGVPFTFCAHHYDIFHSAPPNYPVLSHDASAVITISDYNRRYLRDHHNVADARLRVIHCGIDCQRFQRAESPEAQTAADRPLQLVAVGRLTDVKAHRYMVEACAKLRDRGVDFVLNIIGEGDQRTALESQIDTAGLADRVHLLGAQPSSVVRRELFDADIFVMSSLSEGIPVSLMEAMAMERPVVTTGVKGIPELVSHEENGLLVPVENAEAIADAIQQLADDDERRRQFGAAGRTKVLREFNAETEYERLLSLWREIIDPEAAQARQQDA